MTTNYDIMVSVRDADTGVEVFGAPLTYTIEADETSGPARFNKADDGDGTTFTVVSPSQLSSILQLVVLTADQELTWRFDGQSDAGIVVGEGGIILMAGVTIDAGTATNVKVNNNSDETAQIQLMVAGNDG